MPRFEPFPALRYNLDIVDLPDVAAPPYDVLSEADLDELAGRDVHNIVHIDVPRETAGAERYALAAQAMRAWVDADVLVRDRRPSFTAYRMSFTDEGGSERHTVGVLGALEVVDEGAGGVLPHERTTPKAKTDRLELTRATQANLSPVWGLSLTAGLSALLAEPGEPVGEVTVDGVTHRVERIDDPSRVAAISAAVAANPVVIADGHHRYAISRTYRDEARAEGLPTAAAAELTLAYLGELVAEQLSVEAIHRLYRGIDAASLAAALAPSFTSEPAGAVTPAITTELVARGALCLVDPRGQGTLLIPRPEAFHGVRDLDSARLEHALSGVGHEVDYQHGVSHVLGALASGHADAAVLIRPVSVAEIRRTADEGLLMPPKSTFFTPKLRTGLVIRELF